MIVLAILMAVHVCYADDDETTIANFLDIETPESFEIKSPLKEHSDSLKQLEYFEYLSTLYRKDESKDNLFRNRH